MRNVFQFGHEPCPSWPWLNMPKKNTPLEMQSFVQVSPSTSLPSSHSSTLSRMNPSPQNAIVHEPGHWSPFSSLPSSHSSRPTQMIPSPHSAGSQNGFVHASLLSM